MSRASPLEVVARFRASVVHEYRDGELIYSSRNRILRIRDLAAPAPELVASVPWRGIQRLSAIRVVDRLLKHSILQVRKTRKGEYLAATGHAWWRIDRDGRPHVIAPFADTRPMNRGLCEASDGTVYVAEYRSNPERGPIRIFRTRDLSRFEVAWEFAAGSIRHVHALIPDPEMKERIWVLTGDLDRESHIYYTDDSFRTLSSFLSDGQRSRATDLIVRDGWVYWGMDSPDTPAFVMRAPRHAPQDAEALTALPGPAYYMGQNRKGGMYLGTTAEPGAAVRDRCARIIGVDRSGSWSPLIKSRSDSFPQFGIFYFPTGTLPRNFVVFSQRALVPYEGHMTIAYDRRWE